MNAQRGRALAKAVGLTALLGCAGPADADVFTIVVLPDTQNYVNSALNAPLFTQQTQWVSDQVQAAGNPLNIVFVSHVGDVVSTGTNIIQFNFADASLGVLDGGLPQSVVPWSVVPGNHDYASTGNKASGTDTYVGYFGPARFAGKSWFGGGEASGNNTYQLFEGAGVTYLHIGLEWRPTVNVTNGPTRDPPPIEWARQVIRDHPGMPTIISTHEHLDDSPAGRSAAGQALWNELVYRNDQVIMVLGGHHHGAGGTNDGEYHQVSLNNYGNPVFEILQDYQDYPNGGDGWLRYLTFDTDANAVEVYTYSPVLGMFQDETTGDVGLFASRFTLPLDFATRFDFAPPPPPPIEVFEDTAFRQGAGGYAGTLDKEIRSGGGDSDNGNATVISVDGDDSGASGLQPNHALIRFEDVIGTGAGQIGPGEAIRSARLELNVVNPGSGMNAYQMTAPWDETTTWVGLGGDGVTPGVDTLAMPVAAVGANNSGENIPAGVLSIDITPAFENWRGGAANLGVGLVPFPSGTNGVDFTTSESSAPPALVVRRLRPGYQALTLRQGEGGYTGAADTQLREAAPTTSFAVATTLTVDADDPAGQTNHVLMRFDDVFAPSGPVPADAAIARALLTLDASDAGDGASVHRLLEAWDDTATWASEFGGDGVQADGVEAAAAPDAAAVGVGGRSEIDVTDSLRAWRLDPVANLGWVLLPSGGNGWDIFSSEASPASRPLLTVVFRPCPPDVTTEGSAAGDPLFGVPDGLVTAGDLSYFVDAWLAANAAVADVTTQGVGAGDAAFGAPDGRVTASDIQHYVNGWIAGCP